MSLPAGQQRVLDRIENDLERCEPRLRSMFAIFTRLNRSEQKPRRETLPPPSRRFFGIGPQFPISGRLAVILTIVAMLIAAALFVILSVSSSATQACTPAASHVSHCQSVLESRGRP